MVFICSLAPSLKAVPNGVLSTSLCLMCLWFPGVFPSTRYRLLWLVGLWVWFLLLVREVLFSNPRQALVHEINSWDHLMVFICSLAPRLEVVWHQPLFSDVSVIDWSHSCAKRWTLHSSVSTDYRLFICSFRKVFIFPRAILLLTLLLWSV